MASPSVFLMHISLLPVLSKLEYVYWYGDNSSIGEFGDRWCRLGKFLSKSEALAGESELLIDPFKNIQQNNFVVLFINQIWYGVSFKNHIAYIRVIVIARFSVLKRHIG